MSCRALPIVFLFSLFCLASVSFANSVLCFLLSALEEQNSAGKKISRNVVMVMGSLIKLFIQLILTN